MRAVCKKLRNSLKRNYRWEFVTIPSQVIPTTPPSTSVSYLVTTVTSPEQVQQHTVQTPPIPISSLLPSSQPTPTSPTAIHHQVLDIEAQWKAAKDSMSLTIDEKLNEITTTLSTLTETVEDIVTHEVNKKLTNSVDSRVKQAVTKQLHSTFKKACSKQESEDESFSSDNAYIHTRRKYHKYYSSSDSSDNETSPTLPPPVWKEKGTDGHSRTKHPISPFDPNFYAGCNDDCFSMTTTSASRTSSQKKKKQKTRDWMRQQRELTMSKIDRVSCTKTLLKCAPLSITVPWNGDTGNH